MDKYAYLLRLVDEYNETHGIAHSINFILKCAEIVNAEIVFDGWYIRGFGCEKGYCPSMLDNLL